MSWLRVFLKGFWTSLEEKEVFFTSLPLMPKVILMTLLGRQNRMIEDLTTRIAISMNNPKEPPPEESVRWMLDNPKEASFFISWSMTSIVWFAPVTRISVITQLQPIVLNKWRGYRFQLQCK